MPELPEVETVRKGLNQLISAKTIRQVEVFWPRIIESPAVEVFCTKLQNQVIKQVLRRGKFLIIELSEGCLISHLRMEGKYHFYQQETAPNKHEHVVFRFTDGTELHYQDVRKFGRMTYLPKSQVSVYFETKKLGPEPTVADFDLEVFATKVKASHKKIKPLLLNQQLVVGLGNIYVDEALWQAKIHPETLAKALTDSEIKVLHQAIIEVLHRAVEAGGTTIRSYVNALGDAGNFQVQLNAYGQTGQPCVRCQTPIIKIKVEQRGTHLCPTCQIKKGEQQ
ncbi:DNA-formamidopyrimidine glycosylase [Enterococcus columbae]|uniref:Formamidopyrimidine-DNA glycosylase n=1 Tax=Enterococcus columbae DSM 7374 = ATCC 51263 TaxID=1121865 RepID=S1NFT5_9ENTE|nr:DNA-formamidopyrimidine glycosylase [Enterococcus columbae]EOT44395.1 formamidopyrimidine-DNA glycosylase [Enterococcus columbae DSM 7374 = ATCC 51263]EOW84553.1 formamidopyrimidine-DNA glycosylase [Enterococcus columbae DSM 7374 = ATCC 51263]OJG22535.1 formamidopyrimidine-DNA glycosylase [Enterococcus columbae DSM 7374 = ATCC 51263]